MKILRLAIVLVVALALAAGPVLTHPALANSPDRSDNKVLISGVPQGWAIQVAQPGSDFPRGPGNLPDNTGLVTAYAPLGRPSQVFLWDKTRNAYYLIATIAPIATWPDTALSVPLQYAQGIPYGGLATAVQPSPGYVTPFIPVQPSPGYVTPFIPVQPSPGYVTPFVPVQPRLGYVTPFIPVQPRSGYVTPFIPANPSLARASQQYVVQRGDTLGAIARRFSVTIGAIAALNNIPNPSLIVTGQVLAVPDP